MNNAVLARAKRFHVLLMVNRNAWIASLGQMAQMMARQGIHAVGADDVGHDPEFLF